jgi:hypothetical protein
MGLSHVKVWFPLLFQLASAIRPVRKQHTLENRLSKNSRDESIPLQLDRPVTLPFGNRKRKAEKPSQDSGYAFRVSRSLRLPNIVIARAVVMGVSVFFWAPSRDHTCNTSRPLKNSWQGLTSNYLAIECCKVWTGILQSLERLQALCRTLWHNNCLPLDSFQVFQTVELLGKPGKVAKSGKY